MTRFLRSRSRGGPARSAHRRDWEDLGESPVLRADERRARGRRNLTLYAARR